MRWMDLELCTRDSWCKNRPTRELVHPAHSLPELLGLWRKDWSSLKIDKKPILAMGLSACAEWALNFVQEIAGVSTGPQGGWSTKHILFLSFLVCEAKTGPPYKKKTYFGHETVCLPWKDLELCTRDSWCKYWPTRELVHQAHSLPEFLGLWSKDWSSLKKKDRKPILAMGLSACAEWILNFVQEIASVSTDPQGSWSTKHILYLGFLVCEAMSGPP